MAGPASYSSHFPYPTLPPLGASQAAGPSAGPSMGSQPVVASSSSPTAPDPNDGEGAGEDKRRRNTMASGKFI